MDSSFAHLIVGRHHAIGLGLDITQPLPQLTIGTTMARKSYGWCLDGAPAHLVLLLTTTTYAASLDPNHA